MQKIVSIFDKINEVVGKLASWLTFFLVGIVCIDVAFRYAFQITAAWVTELEWHLFAAIFLLGAGYALQKDHHVRVDLFYSNFSQQEKALVNIVGTVCFLIPWCIVVIYFSTDYVIDSWIDNERSADPGGLPARYLIKSVIPIGFILLLFQAVSLLLKNIFLLYSRKI